MVNSPNLESYSIQNPSLGIPEITRENPLMERVSGWLGRKSAEAFKAARLKLGNAEVLYTLPGYEKWLPNFRLVFSQLSSLINYGRTDMPLTVGIETIAACTRECSYCPLSTSEFSDSRSIKVMPDQMYQEIIDQLASFPRRAGQKGFNGVLHLNGFGEPFLDKKIVERTAYARDKLPEARIGFYSNGDRLTEDTLLKLMEAGIDEILITPHDGTFSDEIIAMERKYRDQNVIILRKPLEEYSNRGGNVQIETNAIQKPNKRCIHPTFAMEITTDGGLLFCSSDSLATQPQGNVQTDTLLRIWNDPHYKKLRRALRHGRLDQLPDICRACRAN